MDDGPKSFFFGLDLPLALSSSAFPFSFGIGVEAAEGLIAGLAAQSTTKANLNQKFSTIIRSYYSLESARMEHNTYPNSIFSTDILFK